MTIGESFARFAKATARQSGHPVTFALAVLVILVWAVTGPIFHFSDTWQLVINTGTTIVTFLMVFLIQNTQNRGSAARWSWRRRRRPPPRCGPRSECSRPGAHPETRARRAARDVSARCAARRETPAPAGAACALPRRDAR